MAASRATSVPQTHRDADVGVVQRGCVVDAVSGHRHDVPLRAKGIGDAQLGFGCAAGEDDFLAAGQKLVELVFVHAVELVSGDDEGAGRCGADADAAGDLCCGQAVVPGDHVDADPGPVGQRDGLRDLRPGRVKHGNQAQQAKSRLDVIASSTTRRVPVQRPPGDGEQAQATCCVVVGDLGQLCPVNAGEFPLTVA